MSCAGCGLVDDITEQRIATSSLWGGPGLGGFGELDSFGALIYCDENGELRTSPERKVRIGETETTSVINETFAFDVAEQDTPTLHTLINPSAARSAWAFAAIHVRWQFEMDGADPVLGADVTLDGTLINQMRQLWGIPYAGGEIETEWNESDSQVVLLGPGESADLEVQPLIIGNTSWSGTSGQFLQSRVAIRSFIVVI